MKRTKRYKGVFFIVVWSCFMISHNLLANSWEDAVQEVELITSWNRMVMEMAVEEDGLMTLKGVRTEAMMHIAMHDALNAIQSKFSYYIYHSNSPKADPIAALAQAAYEVVSNQFPEKQKDLYNELNKWLDLVKNEKAKEAGISLGRAASLAIITKRLNDKYQQQADYTWHPMAPGVYAEFNEHSGTPEGFIFGAGWAAAEPFMLRAQDQFRADPPPEIGSTAYTKAFDEVKEYGRFQSKSRTDDQSHLAFWWKDFVESSHNQLARELVIREKLTPWETARVFALLNMTIYDAYVNVFDNKFYFNHWRPYTAIRWAANDGNPDTEQDVEWNNLHKHTYAFPSYPSAHGTASTAAMTVLANTLGTGDEYAFTMTTTEVDKAGPFSGKVIMDPPTRSFNSFSEAGLEASMSRVYLGIHFRYDSEEGHKLGAQIGEYASLEFLNPVEDGRKVDFKVSGLGYDQFKPLFSLNEKELQKLGVVREKVTSKPGYPCVVSLEDAEIGEEVLLLAYDHIDSNSPYRSKGPIFVRENVIPPVLKNEVPQNLLDRRLSIRAYDEKDMMVNARTIEGSQLLDLIQEIFKNPDAKYIQVHISSPGCFNCQIERL